MHIFETKEFAEVTVQYKPNVKKEDRVKITKSQDAEKVFRAVFDFNGGIEHKEYFYTMFLNRANEVIGVNKISEGGVGGTVVDPSIIFQAAVLVNAIGLILCHNHPSSSLKPSDADINLTKKLKEGGKLLDIDVMDHLILSADNFYSFTDNGLM